jgi:hypothetical protein
MPKANVEGKNVEIVRQVLEHWERHEWGEGRELYDDHCEVVFSTAWLPDPGAYGIGREALQAWISFLDSLRSSRWGSTESSTRESPWSR